MGDRKSDLKHAPHVFEASISKKRNCYACNTEFLSTGSGHRHCGLCRQILSQGLDPSQSTAKRVKVSAKSTPCRVDVCTRVAQHKGNLCRTHHKQIPARGFVRDAGPGGNGAVGSTAKGDR